MFSGPLRYVTERGEEECKTLRMGHVDRKFI